MDYKGAWKHPLSPAYIKKEKNKRSLIAQHPQKGGFTYCHWMDYSDGHNRFIADVVRRYQKFLADINANATEDEQEDMRLYAFGYDMEKMKARCWYETTYPCFSIPQGSQIAFSKRVKAMTDTASLFAENLRDCVKFALFDINPSKNKVKKKGFFKTSMAGNVESDFYQFTSSNFFLAVDVLRKKLLDCNDREILHAWHAILRKASFNRFDYWVSNNDIAHGNPRRVAEARKKLHEKMYVKKIKEALQLPNKPKKEAA